MAQPPIVPPRGPAASGTPPTTPTMPASAPAESGATKSSPDVKPLEGKTTIDEKLSIECEILCYKAVRKITEQIAKEFQAYHSKAPQKDDKEKPVCIIFLDETFKSALQLHQAVVLQVDLLKEGFGQILPPKAEEAAEIQIREGRGLAPMAAPAVVAVTAGIAAATALGKSVIDLLALFRTDVSYAGRSVAIKETSLVLDLAHQLCSKDTWTFLYPRLLLYQPSKETQDSAARLKLKLKGLFEERERVEEALRRLATEVAKEESTLVDRLAQDSKKRKRRGYSPSDEVSKLKQGLIEKRIQLEAQRAQFEALDAKLKALQVSLITPDQKSGVVPLHLVQQAEELLARFQDAQKDTFFLWAEVSTASGGYQIRRSLWQPLINLFSKEKDDGLYYSGGAIVTYAFFGGNAKVVLSGTHRYREPFTQFPRVSGGNNEGNSF